MTKRGSDDASELFHARKRKCIAHWKQHGVLGPLGPGDTAFEDVMKSRFPMLRMYGESSGLVPVSVREECRACCQRLAEKKLFDRKIVYIKRMENGEKFRRISVPRCMVGDPGLTVLYFDLRLFCYPWSPAVPPPQRYLDAAAALRTATTVDGEEVKVERGASVLDLAGIRDLADIVDKKAAETAGQRRTNVAFMNFFDMSNKEAWLPDPYYGLGPLAIKWHRDQHLEPHSHSIVYTLFPPWVPCTGKALRTIEEGDASCGWKLCFQRTWDTDTPPLVIPTHEGDVFMMCDGMNDISDTQNYDHALVAGTRPRISINYREAKRDGNTIADVLKLCEDALLALRENPSCASLDCAFRAIGVLEFDWLRQFWLQGAQHAAQHREYWLARILQLEGVWFEMGTKIEQIVRGLTAGHREEVEICLYHLTFWEARGAQWQDLYYIAPYDTLPSKKRPLAPLSNIPIFNPGPLIDLLTPLRSLPLSEE